MVKICEYYKVKTLDYIIIVIIIIIIIIFV